MTDRLHRLRRFHKRAEEGRKAEATEMPKRLAVMSVVWVLNLCHLRNLWMDVLGGTQWKR